MILLRTVGRSGNNPFNVGAVNDHQLSIRLSLLSQSMTHPRKSIYLTTLSQSLGIPFSDRFTWCWHCTPYKPNKNDVNHFTVNNKSCYPNRPSQISNDVNFWDHHCHSHSSVCHTRKKSRTKIESISPGSNWADQHQIIWLQFQWNHNHCHHPYWMCLSNNTWSTFSCFLPS
jgi:hypothetical protein